MNRWRLGLSVCLPLLALLAAGVALWPDDGERAEIEGVGAPPPVPPFPPRIATDPAYQACLDLLPEDPAAAFSLLRGWTDGGDAARHCQALALIASGAVTEGAGLLETLAASPRLPVRARALLLDQAADAWSQIRRHEDAYRATARALTLAPDDVDLLIRHARAAAALGRDRETVADFTHVLTLMPGRVDALLGRAIAWRLLDRLDQAAADIAQAAAIAPDDAEVLLERGIQRQRRGDLTGARADWERVVSLDPDSETADLAEQNLALLAAGPTRR